MSQGPLRILWHWIANDGNVEFTGISAPYEAPTSPEIHIKTDECDVEGAVKIIAEYLEKQGLLSGDA